MSQVPAPDSKASAHSETTIKISCKNVWKVFGSDSASLFGADGSVDRQALARGNYISAVCGASFDVFEGEIFIIMGLSGSGKSTLVRCMTRLIEPSAGSIQFDSQDLLKVSDAELINLRRHKMGMVFQHFALLPNRDVLGNVAFPLQVQDVERSKREERAREMISLVGLEGREKFFPDELSGGQQQRVGIARSLASDPAIWFLDEPFSALDPLIRADLQDELLRLQEQLHKTTVFITHDLDEAIKIADRIAIMDLGRIVQIGSPEDLVLNPANDYVARFVKNVPRSKVVRVSSIMRDATSSDSVGDWVVNANDRLADVAPRIGESANSIAIQDDSGTTLGYVDREKFVRVLAGVV